MEVRFQPLEPHQMLQTVNITEEARFILLGLTTTPVLQELLFVLFAAAYVSTMAGNLMVIVVIRLDSRLHTPMYFFLANLALIEIFYTTTVIPNTLNIFVNEDKSISFVGCFIQMFIFITLGGSECVLLGTMAYDRYVAICRPLLYTAIMDRSFSLQLALTCWILGFLNSLLHTILAVRLPFCHDRHIKHCVSHLMVVSIFFGTVISIYIRPTSQTSSDQNRIISVVYGVFTPLFNPLIYSFRNQDFQKAFLKVL
ncbi:olfactory receptor 8I2-like [Spea bombifrons]|uniref:olfactory receptor 8I2-like n=1 Tax=Spea bombifrons TaxID=233779 RepID=UPI00234A5E96|nr:olfactory receptor 8I2-like [Spea bombifrons]